MSKNHLRRGCKRRINKCHDITAKQRPGPCTTSTHRRVRPLVSASRTQTWLHAGRWMEEGARRDADTERGGQAGANGLLPCAPFSQSLLCLLWSIKDTGHRRCANPPPLPSSRSSPPSPSLSPTCQDWRGKQNKPSESSAGKKPHRQQGAWGSSGCVPKNCPLMFVMWTRDVTRNTQTPL